MSDKAGRFSVRLPMGSTRFTVTAPNYEVSDRSTDIGADTALLSLALLPAMHEVRVFFGQPWKEWNGKTLPGGPFRQVSFPIVVHNPGTIRMNAEACLSGCLASEMALICAEIRDGSNRVVASARGHYDIPPQVPTVQTKGGEHYEVKMGVCQGVRCEIHDEPVFHRSENIRDSPRSTPARPSTRDSPSTHSNKENPHRGPRSSKDDFML